MHSALWAHSADCYCYLRLSFRCGNPRLCSDFPLPVHALVHCYRGDIAGRAYVEAGEEDASMADPGDVVDNKVPGSDRIDWKVE
jgi:hypothetical protein